MRLLIVEDEPYLLDSLNNHLVAEGFTVDTAENARQALESIFIEDYDVILLDLNLPDGDGLTVLKRLRENHKDAAVIIITARGEVEDRVTGLNLGSDDYILKPFSVLELTARINAVLRRKFNLEDNVVAIEDIQIHLDDPNVSCCETQLPLTKIEYKLIRYLALNRGKTISRISLAEHIWGNEVDTRFSLDFINSHVKNLRKKLKEAGGHDPIQTIYGVGYRIDKE